MSNLVNQALFGFQVHDMINKIDDGSGVLDFDDFLTVSNVFGQFVLVTSQTK